MLKRMKITIIATVVATLMLCGWTAYAATSSSATTSTTINGKLTTMTADTITLHTDAGDKTVPLASSVWVYLNDEKAQLSDLRIGNEIEVILNNKKQAAYVKGSAETPIASGAEPSVTPVPSELPSPVPVKEAPSSPVGPTSSPTKMKDSAPEANLSGGRADLADMDVSVDGQHFNLHIKLMTKGSQGSEFDLRIQSPHAGTIHLTGAQAQAWIANLLGSLDLSSPDAKKLLGQQLAKQYNLDAAKLNVHLNMHSKDHDDDEDKKDDRREPQKENDKDQDKDKNSEINKDRDKNIEKSKDKNENRNKDNDKDNDKSEKKHENSRRD